jgi:hydroxyacylglutathione hydrolase
MALKVKQFRYSNDNLSYLIYGQNSALVVDGGAVGEICDFLKQQAVVLLWVANTHGHADHTSGNNDLLKQPGVSYLDREALLEAGGVALEGEPVMVFSTPGHTDDSISFHVGSCLITGDTLFNGTVGNCFSGDLEGFYQSVKRLTRYPSETIVYAGHDYVEYAMQFAKLIEPDNHHIDLFLKRYSFHHVFSTLADEQKVNPYLRFNEKNLVARLKREGLSVETEFDRFKGVMGLS